MSTHPLDQEARRTPPTPADGPAWLRGGRIPCLDGIRAVAILLVLFHHVTFPGVGWGPVEAIHDRCGSLGVQIFFVLSGFLITTLMLREVGKTGRLGLGAFYWRRFLRIVPVYLVYLAVLGGLQAAGRARLDGRAWLALGTYTVNFMTSRQPHLIGHVWSLSVEEHFYVLWPLLMAFWTPGRCRNAAAACVAGALGLRWLGQLAFPDSVYAHQCAFWTFTRMDDIAVGCLLAFAARDAVWRRRLDAFVADGRRLALVAAAFLACQALLSNQVGGFLLPPTPLKILRGLGNDVNTFSIAVLLWAVVARPAGVADKVLNYPLVRGVGVISYSLYLWHPLFCGNDAAWFCRFPQNLVPMFTVACLSYFLIEKPFLSLKARTGRAAAAPRPSASPGRNKKAALTMT